VNGESDVFGCVDRSGCSRGSRPPARLREPPTTRCSSVLRSRRASFRGSSRSLKRPRMRKPARSSKSTSQCCACTRFRYRYVSLDRQTFGLPQTIRRIWENFYVLEGEIVIRAGFTQSGVLSPWDFKMEDVDAWPKDAAFAYFESLLGKEPTERSDTENRLITALGIASVSTASLRAPLRHVLYAVALEALLGDPPPAERTHRIAVRAAFLTCDLLGPEPRGRHGPERPACPILAYATQNEMRKKARAMFPNGSPICSYYEWIRNVATQRNTVLHEALRGGDHRSAASAEGRVDEVILEYARVAADGPLRSLADLDAEIRRVVEANPILADGTFGKPARAKTKPRAREGNV